MASGADPAPPPPPKLRHHSARRLGPATEAPVRGAGPRSPRPVPRAGPAPAREQWRRPGYLADPAPGSATLTGGPAGCGGLRLRYRRPRSSPARLPARRSHQLRPQPFWSKRRQSSQSLLPPPPGPSRGPRPSCPPGRQPLARPATCTPPSPPDQADPGPQPTSPQTPAARPRSRLRRSQAIGRALACTVRPITDAGQPGGGAAAIGEAPGGGRGGHAAAPAHRVATSASPPGRLRPRPAAAPAPPGAAPRSAPAAARPLSLAQLARSLLPAQRRPSGGGGGPRRKDGGGLGSAGRGLSTAR